MTPSSLHIESSRKGIPYAPAHQVFEKLYGSFPNHFLLESHQVSLFSGRFSLIGLDAALHIQGKDENFSIKALHDRGRQYLGLISQFLNADYEEGEDEIKGFIRTDRSVVEESQRCHAQNISRVIRSVLDLFQQDKKTLMGLYGAFSYDFIRLFEDLGNELEGGDFPDFSLMLFDRFVFIDQIKESAEVVCYGLEKDEVNEATESITNTIENSWEHELNYSVSEPIFAIEEEQFMEMVESAKTLIKEGEIFQVVFSNIVRASFEGSAYALYKKYREINPSPYLYYFDFGDEQLVGASPEMMVRCEDNQVHLRPIAGTIPRGADPVDDHEQMLELLNDPKERAELDMLVDLGRNDLSRICKPGIDISDYRFVEKYSRVMHTVAHLTGELRDGYNGLDALISCLNAGTLTGSPKVAAMKVIDQHEQERRGYYGGAFGQLSFSGEVDTAIMIRTAHIKNGELRYQSGAGIVYDSDPRKEYRETLHKAQAFLETLS